MFGSPYLRYLQSFRYPLAGEFALMTDLAMNRIPSDWGLEIGLLSEVYRHVAPSRIAQVDLGLFDHSTNPSVTSLLKVFSAWPVVFGTVLRGLMEHEGCIVSRDQLPTLEVLYRRVGQDRVRQFGLDSVVNGLPYDRHSEELAVQSFPVCCVPVSPSLSMRRSPTNCRVGRVCGVASTRLILRRPVAPIGPPC